MVSKKSVFIFRRDYRLNDNTGLIQCFQESSKVLPIFIFTPEQIEKNDYFSSNGFQFLLESLQEVDNELKEKYKSKIHYFYGENTKVLSKLLKEYHYNSIYFNMDYTPYALERDKEIEEFCTSNNIECHQIEDYLLNKIGTYLKSDQTAFQKYTPFKNNAKKIPVMKPNPFSYDSTKTKTIFDKIKTSFDFDINQLSKYYQINPNLLIHGGRENALFILKNIKNFLHYPEERNDLPKPTTHLSAYIKFGCVSIREVYHTILKEFGINHGLIDQLYWREFYYYLAYYFPRVLHGKSLKEKYDEIKWGNDKKVFKAWTEGKTGFPAVDAGMRELNETGFMHNRARLITSGILIKILNCDWRWGEKYFAQQLIDYDPTVNNGNWQWSSGSGADSQPYFRIMSPWKQAIDNDPECNYIKKWIPELRDVPNKDILNWDKVYSKYIGKNTYLKPIVDYEKMRKEISKIYKKGLYDD
jgi:deoxyribodipyrimidine photo-lyase